LKQCDLLIVIGTSLLVHPFASLVNYVRPEVPRVLINREAVGPFVRSSRDKRDSFWEGDADEGVRRLAEELGWTEEMEGMIDEGSEKLGKEWAAMAGGDDNSGEGREEAKKNVEERAVEVEKAVAGDGNEDGHGDGNRDGSRDGNRDVDDLEKAIAEQLNLIGKDDDKAKI